MGGKEHELYVSLTSSSAARPMQYENIKNSIKIAKEQGKNYTCGNKNADFFIKSDYYDIYRYHNNLLYLFHNKL
jgi:hypothetical protein